MSKYFTSFLQRRRICICSSQNNVNFIWPWLGAFWAKNLLKRAILFSGWLITVLLPKIVKKANTLLKVTSITGTCEYSQITQTILKISIFLALFIRLGKYKKKYTFFWQTHTDAVSRLQRVFCFFENKENYAREFAKMENTFLLLLSILGLLMERK